MRNKPLRWLALGLVGLAAASPAQKTEKKLYCWNEGNTRVCGDALPPEAVNHARDEINANSGLRKATVGQAQSEAEREAVAAEAATQRAAQESERLRSLSDQSLLLYYATEAELQRVFNERTQMIDDNVRTARYNLSSLRSGLVTLLERASGRELTGKPVPEQVLTDIQSRRSELVRQQVLLDGFTRARTTLDNDIAQTLARYRQLKGIAPAEPAAGAAPAVTDEAGVAPATAAAVPAKQ